MMVIMFRYVQYLLFICLYPEQINGASYFKGARNAAFDGRKILENPITTIYNTSLVSCTKFCDSVQACLSFNYNKLSSTCVLLDVDLIDVGSTNTQAENGWIYYYFVRDYDKSLRDRCVATIPSGVCSLFCLHYIYDSKVSTYTKFAWMCSQLDGGEMVKVDRALKRHCVEAILADKPDNMGDIYIQSNRNLVANTWHYHDGTPITYFNWNSGQPNELTDPYIALKKSKGLFWSDVNGSNQNAVICQQT